MGTTLNARPALWLVIVLLVLQGCSTTRVKTTEVVSLDVANEEVSEERLLDVGINLFDPGLETAGDDDSTLYPEVRQGEARYLPVNLMTVMQSSAYWGAVRVVPSDLAAVDVHVYGKILHSDGETLKLRIRVSDSTNREWFEREYKEVISDFIYKKRRTSEEPFRTIYHRIANDIAAYHRSLDNRSVKNIRTVAELRFAENFSPDAFGGHLSKDKKGLYSVNRLPSELDPMLVRVRKIRERDYLFVDTLQDYYSVFHRQMDAPYLEWRERSYEHVGAIRDLSRRRTGQILAGVASIIGGIAAAGGDDRSTRAAGSVGIAAGGALISSGMRKGVEMGQHQADLNEISESLTTAITPQVLELDDETVTLTGTVQDQYQQWRGLLREIYLQENALPESQVHELKSESHPGPEESTE